MDSGDRAEADGLWGPDTRAMPDDVKLADLPIQVALHNRNKMNIN